MTINQKIKPSSINDLSQSEVLIEFHRIGDNLKVTAVDPKTMIETSILAPVTTTDKSALELAAIKKLQYVLSKQ